ncbi:MAG: magnesium transporter [Cycloclasticus sp.]|jgi:magnesium transporter
MAESLSSTSKKSGLPPGSLIHVGSVLETITSMSVIDYDTGKASEHPIQSLDEILKYKDTDTVTWVIIEGLTDTEVIARVGELFDIHHLVLEDILNTHQRAKFEEYENYLFIVLKCLLPEHQPFSIIYEQISILVLKNFIFVFKEKTDDLLKPIIQRIKTSKGRFTSLGTDYLAYTILDAIVDQNFILIDSLDDAVTTLEDELMTSEPSRNTLNTIQQLKREIISIRRYVSPVRELLAGMLRSESHLIDAKTHVYLRDVSDHAIRVTESIESYRDILTGLLEIYISSVSNKMNEVMKVLTVFASIFIPLTFIAGIYGMNFEYMPELKWKWAYPSLWVAFIAIPVVLLIYFKKKKWL